MEVKIRTLSELSKLISLAYQSNPEVEMAKTELNRIRGALEFYLYEAPNETHRRKLTLRLLARGPIRLPI